MQKPVEQRYWYGAWQPTGVRQAIGSIEVSSNCVAHDSKVWFARR